jgi:3-deoxy-D-manno-octulosonic-acid transferase
VDQLIQEAGLRGVRLSQVSAPLPWQVGLVDTFGVLPQYYGLADVVFVGGSLIPHGGQNPLEPASLGKPVVFGPSMQNFAEITRQLLAHEAARQLDDGAQLVDVLRELLTNPTGAQAMGQRARALTEQFAGTTQQTLQFLKGLLTGSAPQT